MTSNTHQETARHTPGPWMTVPSPISSAADGIHGGDGEWVCDVPTALRGRANARLIAEAPAMLEALREAEWMAYDLDEEDDAQHYCLWCSGYMSEGHAPRCRLRAILNRIDRKE